MVIIVDLSSLHLVLFSYNCILLKCLLYLFCLVVNDAGMRVCCCMCVGVIVGEKTPLVIFGIAKVKHVRISALLSGLKLEADLENGQASATYRQKVRGISWQYPYALSVTHVAGIIDHVI